MKKAIIIIICALTINALSFAGNTYKQISKQTYYDKTLGCILGQIGGFLSGYEFTTLENGEPNIGMPDEWFTMCYGPYGGGPKRRSAGENCVVSNGKILQDDDYHIDFFNQLIFKTSSHIPTSLDIQKKWKECQVRDWGGGDKAMEIINKRDFIPPFTGQLEWGNIFSWCTEPYIENETVGCIAPGMPQTAQFLTSRFAKVTGEYESVLWGEFWGVMYSIAYFEDNAISAMQKASVILPEWSWAKTMYNKAIELHNQYPNDWRTAAKELAKAGRYIYRIDNKLAAYDINGGYTVLSILYGNNDYYNSIKIASLMGYDGDCTAATVGGLLGIIKGFSGTDAKVKEVIYDNGNGVLINNGKYVPYISQNYPYEQKFTDIAAMYQSNMEKIINIYGGTISNNSYTIAVEDVKSGCNVVIPNRDFENDLIPVSKELNGGAQGGVDKIQSFPPHSGVRTIRFLSTSAGGTGKIFVKTDNLEIGKKYKIGAYLVAKGNNNASLFVENGTQFLTSSVFNNGNDWYNRTIQFTASNNSANIGLFVPPTSDGLFNAYLDDITIEECVQENLSEYEAENLNDGSELVSVIQDPQANASGGKHILVNKGGKVKGIVVNALHRGEYILKINFSNPSTEVITARVMQQSSAQAKFPFYITGNKIGFEENTVEVSLVLEEGVNTVSIEQFSGNIYIDKIEVIADYSFYMQKPTTGDVPTFEDSPYVNVYLIGKDQIRIEQKADEYKYARIYSVSGQLRNELKLYPGAFTYQLKNLSKGMYVIALFGRDSKTVKKITY